MGALPPGVTGNNLDEDTDDVFQARAELNSALAQINAIIVYLSELFGADGTKGTAIATMFSNQAVLFPAGTRMVFVQPDVPPGWVKWVWGDGVMRYIQAVDNNTGGQNVGSYDTTIATSATTLLPVHLPGMNLSGTADFQGQHQHSHNRLHISVNNPGVASVRVAQSDGINEAHAYIWESTASTTPSGNHSHNVTSLLAGSSNFHDHLVNMTNYRPRAWTAVIGIKA